MKQVPMLLKKQCNHLKFGITCANYPQHLWPPNIAPVQACPPLAWQPLSLCLPGPAWAGYRRTRLTEHVVAGSGDSRAEISRPPGGLAGTCIRHGQSSHVKPVSSPLSPSQLRLWFECTGGGLHLGESGPISNGRLHQLCTLKETLEKPCDTND